MLQLAFLQAVSDSRLVPMTKEFLESSQPGLAGLVPCRISRPLEVWRRGSVIASWLLDLTAAALFTDPDLVRFTGRVSDSGEGRWTVAAAVDEAVPAPVLSAALYARFTSRGEADFGDKVLSAMRYEFGGHVEKAADRPRGA